MALAPILFKNNATSRLSVAIDGLSVGLSLLPGEGARFSSPVAPEYAYVTIEDRRTGQIEICKMTSRSGDTLIVTRAQEGSAAQSFNPGATVSQRLTAGTLEAWEDYIVALGGYTQPDADDRFVNVTGDMMSGPLIVPAPSAPNHALNKLFADTTYAPVVHQHTTADITDLGAALAVKMDVAPVGAQHAANGSVWEVVDWNNLYGKPPTFPPTLPIAMTDVTGLPAALDALVEEAPSDGTQYGREGLAWTAIIPDVTEAPLDGNVYSRRGSDGSWVVSPGSGTIGEAPIDGQQYARKDASWAVVVGGSGGAVDWVDITNKPVNFPTTWTLVAAKPTNFQSDWNTTVINKPTTFLPSAHVHPISDVTGLQGTLDAKEPMITPGTTSQWWRGDKTWQPLGTLTANYYTKTETDARYLPLTGGTVAGPLTVTGALVVNGTITGPTMTAINNELVRLDSVKVTDAPTDGGLYARRNANWETIVIPAPAPQVGLVDVGTSPPGTPLDKQLFWEVTTGFLYIRYNDGTSTQWVQVNSQPGSIGEAPIDGQPYVRKDGGWAVGASGGGGGTINEAPTDGSGYLRVGLSEGWSKGIPLAGGTFTGPVACSQGLVINAVNASNYASQANTNYGGLGGFAGFGGNASTYGIIGYGGYGVYVNGVTNFFSQLTCTSCTFNVSTTTSSPTAYLSTSGGLFRSTSSVDYKTGIEAIDPAYADKVLQLQPIFYRPGENTVDPTDWSRFGFSVEDAYGIDFRFTSCSYASTPIIEQKQHPHPDHADETIPVIVGYDTATEALPIDVDLKAIVACLLDVVRRQGDRIAALEAR
jgi:hypothetical protein